MRKGSMIDASESVRRKKVRRTFLLLNCLFEFYAGITGATFVLFLYSKGLNTMEANLVVAMSLIVSFFMEIPTGALADSMDMSERLYSAEF